MWSSSGLLRMRDDKRRSVDSSATECSLICVVSSGSTVLTVAEFFMTQIRVQSQIIKKYFDLFISSSIFCADGVYFRFFFPAPVWLTAPPANMLLDYRITFGHEHHLFVTVCGRLRATFIPAKDWIIAAALLEGGEGGEDVCRWFRVCTGGDLNILNVHLRAGEADVSTGCYIKGADGEIQPTIAPTCRVIADKHKEHACTTHVEKMMHAVFYTYNIIHNKMGWMGLTGAD